jgi:hypothetical protein
MSNYDDSDGGQATREGAKAIRMVGWIFIVILYVSILGLLAFVDVLNWKLAVGLGGFFALWAILPTPGGSG